LLPIPSNNESNFKTLIKTMQNFEFNITRSLLVERGGAAKLGERIAAMGHERVLIVTDPGLLKAGMLDPSLASLKANRVEVSIYSDVQADPPESVIKAAAVAVQESNAQCVIGFGGGSSLDVAKLAALIARTGQPLSEAYGVNLAKGPGLPLVLIPTTAGTGSEVTPISIVTTGEAEKKGVVSSFLIPSLALLDAELTRGLPSHITAATGIDAMVHAIEAYTSKRLKNPISDCLAREALKLISGSLHKACRHGDDIRAREDMLLGACLAGMAFANAPVAAVHALAYPIGALFHVPHGLSNALVLPSVLRFNCSASEAMYAQLAEIIVPNKGQSDAAKAQALVDYASGLATDLGLPSRLRDVGISQVDIPRLATDAMKQTRLLVNNPRELTLEDATRIYAEAL
jgi:alcohol dehydrogenase